MRGKRWILTMELPTDEVASTGRTVMPYVTTADGTEIFFKDWGNGPPIVLSHGWPLSSDSWESQMLHLASHGFRVRRPRSAGARPLDPDVERQRDEHLRRRPGHAHRAARPAGRDAGRVLDRRGRGGPVHRSSRRPIGSPRSSWSRRSRRSCCGPTTTPTACRSRCSTRIRAASLADRAQLYRDARRRPVLRQQPDRREGVAGHPRRVLGAGHAVGSPQRATSASGRSPRPTSAPISPAIDMPTLVIHGDDDQIVPFAVGGAASAALVDWRRLIDLRGRAPRPHRHPPGATQRRSAGVRSLA